MGLLCHSIKYSKMHVLVLLVILPFTFLGVKLINIYQNVPYFLLSVVKYEKFNDTLFYHDEWLP